MVIFQFAFCKRLPEGYIPTIAMIPINQIINIPTIIPSIYHHINVLPSGNLT